MSEPVMSRSKGLVYIVDDDEAMRKALGFLLKSEGYAVVLFTTAQEFLDGYDANFDACLVVDVRMPGMSGLELQETLAQKQINIPIIIITGHGDVAMAVKAMKAGAADFLEKPFENKVFLERIRHCLTVSAKIHKTQKQQMDSFERLATLTEREREVLDLLVAGKLNKQIAAELAISVRTVEAHRAKIMKKLQANTLSDIVRIAMSV